MSKLEWMLGVLLLLPVLVLGTATHRDHRHQGHHRRCVIGNVPFHHNLDIHRFAGMWYMLSRLKGTSNFTSAIIYFVIHHEHHMSSYTVSARGGNCQPEIEGSWHTGNMPGDLFTDNGPVSGLTKVVYVNHNYTYAVIYQCLHVNVDGTCAVKFVDYIGRRHVLPAKVKKELAGHLRGLCVRPNDFMYMSRDVPHCLHEKIAEYRTLHSFEGRSLRETPVFSRRYRRSINLDKGRLIGQVLESHEVISRGQAITAKDVLKKSNSKVVVKEDEGTIKRLVEIAEEEEEEDLAHTRHESDGSGDVSSSHDVLGLPPGSSDEVAKWANNKTRQCVNSVCAATCRRKLMRVDSLGCTICTCGEELVEVVDGALEPKLPTDTEYTSEERTQHAKLPERSKDVEVPELAQIDVVVPDIHTVHKPCANVLCKDWCPHGYVLTAQGCMTCKCRVEPSGIGNAPKEIEKLPEPGPAIVVPCAIPMCSEECTHGYMHTEQGCMTCKCRDTPSGEVLCAVPMCSEECTHGYVHTEHGCMTCKCREIQLPVVVTNVPCATPMCAVRCPNGYVYTQQGCMTCKCRGSGRTAASTGAACHVKDIQTAENIDMKKMGGRWYILAMLAGTVRFTSATIFLHVHNNSKVSAFFSAAQGADCFPTVFGTWTKTGRRPGHFTATYPHNTGPLRIVYINPEYTYFITYQCFRVNSDGTCSKEYIDLIGREPVLPVPLRNGLLRHAHNVCGRQVADFVDLTHPVSCSLTLPTWAQQRSCKVNDFPTATNLDWNRMLGHWYTVVQPRDGEDLRAGEYLLKARTDGAVNIIFHAYSEGGCIEARRATMYPDPSNPGQLTLQVAHSKSEGRIVFTDYTSMVFYQCSKVNGQGACVGGHDTVEVLHRQRHPTRHLVDYGAIIVGLCIDAERVTNVSHRVTCPIRDFCRVNDILEHPNLNIDRFSGRWLTLATLKIDMSWDYVTAIFARESPVTSAVWYTGSRNGQCLPTSRALLRFSRGTTNMTLSYGRTQAIFKVLYTDYTSYAITYECERKSRDGHCSHNAEHLEVIARRESAMLTEQLLEQLAPHLGKACKEKEDLRQTTKQADCPIRRPPSSCKVDYMATPGNFNLTNFMGTWYTIAKNKQVRGITSVYLEMRLVGPNTVRTATHFTRRGYCVAGTKKTITSNPVYPAHFTSTHGRREERAWVLYVSPDYDSAVVYQCDLEGRDGSCVQGHVKVTILSRTTTITVKAKVAITEALLSACIEPTTMHDMMHTGECRPMRQSPSTRPPCSIHSIPATKKLDTKQMMGRWFILWRMRGSPTLDGDAVVDLSAGEDKTVHAQYTGSRRGTCVPATTATWRLRSTDKLSDFTVTSKSITGRLKVMHTNYQEALVYECHQVSANGTCIEGQDSLDVYSRSHQIPRRLRMQLFKHALKLCRDARKLTAVRHTLACENIQAKACTLERVPVIAQVDLPRLMGTWYSSSRLTSSPSWHAGVVDFDLLPNRKVLAKVTGARKGKCMKVKTTVLEAEAGRAEFRKPNGGLIKLVFTNQQQALIYECGSEQDGRCQTGHMTVDILSRSSDPLPAGVMTQLAPFLGAMCLKKTDFTTTTSEVDCTETLFEQAQCMIKMEDILVQRHFDINMLLGEWYGYAHTDGDNSLASTKNLLSRDEQGNLKVYYTGSRSGRCARTKEATIEVNDNDPSVFTIYHDGRSEQALILHVSSDELVIYTCYLKLPDGTCSPEHTSVEIFRRRQNMLGGMSPHIRQAVSRACFNPAEFTLIIHDVDCPLDVPHESCSFSGLPVDKNFDLRALTGQWYTISRLTPRGDLKRKSSRNYIVYKSRDTLALIWIAKMGATCTEPKQGSMQAIPNEHSGIFRTTFGSWTSITKFIHLSDNYAITFDCVQPSSRSDVMVSACALSEAEVEIHSRRPTTPQTAINVLKDMLRQKTCIDVNRMDDMRPADTCPLTVTHHKSCRIDEIPLHPNVTMPLLAGAWFQIMHTKTDSVLPTMHGELFIDTANHHMGWMTLHMRGKAGEDCDPHVSVQAYASTLDRAHWLFMATNSMTTSAGTLKIVYVDSNLLVLHTCLGLSPVYKALCGRTKEAVQVYSHRRYLNAHDRATVRGILRHKLCVDEHHLHRTTHTQRCGIPRYAKKARSPLSCKVHDYTSQEGFQPRKFSGVWYEVERTRYSHANLWESPVTHITYHEHNHLSFSHAGSRENECIGPFHAHLTPNRPTGTGTATGDMTMWLGQRDLVGSPWSLHFPYKVIWTDYKVAVVYSCHQVADTGRCRHQGEQVHILSRSPKVNIKMRLHVYKIITDRLCVDVVDLVEPANEANCLGIFGIDLPSRRLPSPTQPCDAIKCDLICNHGYAQSEAGCDMCACRHLESDDGSGDTETEQAVLTTEDGSGEELVPMDTAHHIVGDINDGSGEDDIIINTKGPTPTKVTCGNTVCFYLYCPYGFKVNANGCTICTCADRPETVAGSTNVRLFWVNKGFGNYGIRQAIIEPYIKGMPDGLVSDKAPEGN